MRIQLHAALMLAVAGCARAPARDVTPPESTAARASSISSVPAAQPSPPARAVAAAPVSAVTAAAAAKPDELVAVAMPLPGATPPVSLDFIFYEPDKSRVWVPAGGSGSVDVFDVGKHGFARVEGFKTAEREAHGKKRVLGPSAGAIAGSFAYIGNRATQEVCSVDLQTLKKGACLKLASPIDCVEFVPLTQEVWVTAPSSQALIVLEALPKGLLKPKSTIKLDGAPEGYALDEPHGLFLTNLEDKGTTLGIDISTHAIRTTWNAACSADGPRGVAVDAGRGLLFVACTDHVQVIDAQGGALLGKLDTGGGLDNISYVPKTGLLYAAAGKAARLTVARVDPHGQLALVAVGQTAEGARNAVADGNGTVYVTDPQGAHLLVLRAKQSDAAPLAP